MTDQERTRWAKLVADPGRTRRLRVPGAHFSRAGIT